MRLSGMTNPFNPGYFYSDELRNLGFARVGERCAIARNCTIIGLENISIGDDVRIDGFTSIICPRGSVKIGSHVHIASACGLGARGGIEIGDYSSLSQGVRLFTAIDDFSGLWMSNATLPDEVLGIQTAPIRIGRHVPVGANSIVLPGVKIEDGAAVAAMSLVTGSLPGWFIYAGNPARQVAERARRVLKHEQTLKAGLDRGAAPD
jgi:acetyltransferase-like isoleucine patch superfamily enzyme